MRRSATRACGETGCEAARPRGSALWSLLWLIALLGALTSGCCTAGLWTKVAPREGPAEIRGAWLDTRGVLSVGILARDGTESRYVANETPDEPRLLRAQGPWPSAPPAGARTLAIRTADDAPLLRLDEQPQAFVWLYHDELWLCDPDAPPPHLQGPFEFEGLDAIDWRAAGTYGCVALTPVTVAADILLIPVDLIYFPMLLMFGGHG